MFSIFGRSARMCDSWSRRELLTMGGLSLFGLGLPELLTQRAAAKPQRQSIRRDGFGSADSVILVFLQGSPSHIDLWDPKPEAPAEIRGEFKPIATSTPGLFVGEVLPMLAQQAKHFNLVRSIGVDPKGLRNHGAAIYMLMTGHDPRNFSPTGLAVPPSREDLPSVGAVVARYKPAEQGRFNNIAVGASVKEGREVGVGQGAGLLGGAYDPYTMYDDATKPLNPQGFALPADMSLERLQSRVDLKAIIETRTQSEAASFDAYYDTALSLIQSNRAVRAFRLQDEAAETRERYGKTQFGQSCLLARRLIEADTRFVQVTWPARSDDEPAPGPDGSWDTHRNNFPMLRDHRCPVFDQSLSALIEDMAARGLLEKTMVVAIGEFGRSPKIGSPTTNNVGPGGRDHWPECYSFLIAGGGVQPGAVYGESDRHGGWPKNDAVHPYDLIATIYHALGINPKSVYHDTLNRPRRLVQSGMPVLGLF
ncbi:MAG: DUF1501 domain-containing protein [Planctomycetaceae bacterium]|jgi:hypothetical protein|nr:DUF1501 domain-containing protein [Planctomycetaceae bacterium]MBT6154262.1 DUF1501 domain-containing protein [Planctomycetaceae bacterium]MBT6485562.1 DUF1501 domain-containing protein [Planctomycetaceae bacterium]MBT6496009.1 DUF1501 domain-containing protein [Planctomycetaceae bacterium]